MVESEFKSHLNYDSMNVLQYQLCMLQRDCTVFLHKLNDSTNINENSDVKFSGRLPVNIAVAVFLSIRFEQ